MYISIENKPTQMSFRQNIMEKQESKIRKVFFSEVTVAVTIVSVSAGFIFWITGPQNTSNLEIQRIKDQMDAQQKMQLQIQNIKDNDLHTIEGKVSDLQDQVIDLQQEVIKVETLLDERLPAKK